MNPVTDPNAVINTVEELEEELSRPFPDVVEIMKDMDGDLIILGVGGKIGPTLAKMAVRAAKEAGVDKKVYGVDISTDTDIMRDLAANGVETIACNMMDAEQLKTLPDAPNVVFMVGRKFGSTGSEHLTWGVNAFLTGLAMQRYKNSRVVGLSTGCVYEFVSAASGGSVESDIPAPIGDYAQSCLGRERMMEYFCHTENMPLLVFRLNYSHEVRYGVICDIAQKIMTGEPIDITMGCFNVIWQRDVNAAILRSFSLATVPPAYLNVTGKEMLSIKDVALQLGDVLGKKPVLQGEESDTAFLSNPDKYMEMFGAPSLTADQIIKRVAHWVQAGGENLGKPTHFETKNGKF